MPVDKSGKSMNEHKSDVVNNITVIKPYKSHDLSLDNLENIEGFHEEGHINSLYGFKLLDNGMYLSEEIKTVNTLNDLENVEGLNKEGKSNVLYLFKFSNGIYSREEYDMKEIVNILKAHMVNLECQMVI
jgi:hypothetical protein